MTHTTRELEKRAPTPPRRAPRWRNRWVWVAVAILVIAATILAVVALWPKEEAAAPSTTSPEATPTTVATTAPPGARPTRLAWTPASAPPTGDVSAITATDTGFLAATAEGVQFWTSADGDSWTLLEPPVVTWAFSPEHRVVQLRHGGAGFVADAFSPLMGFDEAANYVWTSPDGVTWHVNALIPEVPDIPSPYVGQGSRVSATMVGPDGFVALGVGFPSLDLERVCNRFAPGYTEDEVQGVNAEVRPEGAVLIVDFEDGEFVEIPFTDLDITPEDLPGIFEDEGEASAIQPYAWWSADGATWEPIVTDLPEYVVPGFSAVTLGTDDGFYIFALGPDPNDPEGPGIMSGFHSSDGRAWTEFALEGPPEGWMWSVTFGKGMFVGIWEDQAGEAVWTSPDARSWTRLPDTIFEIEGEDQRFMFYEVLAGGAGYALAGNVEVEFAEPELVLTKDGYEVTFGDEGQFTLVAESTGEVLAVLDFETMATETVEMVDDEAGLSFVDIASGETLVAFTHDEIGAAHEALFEDMPEPEPPVGMLRYSTDLETWTTDTEKALFGENRAAAAGAIGEDVAVAIVVVDPESESPQTELWVGTPTS